MNETMHKIVTFGVIGLLFYLLVWPFLNSIISGNYYIKAGTEGAQTMSYAVRVGSDLRVTASIDHYNNVATNAQGDANTGPFVTTIDYSTYEKIQKIINEYRGFHIFARRHTGYAFYYSSNDNASLFYSTEDKTRLLQLAEIITYIARGDEKIDSKKSSQTYSDLGLQRLNELYEKLDL